MSARMSPIALAMQLRFFKGFTNNSKSISLLKQIKHSPNRRRSIFVFDWDWVARFTRKSEKSNVLRGVCSTGQFHNFYNGNDALNNSNFASTRKYLSEHHYLVWRCKAILHSYRLSDCHHSLRSFLELGNAPLDYMRSLYLANVSGNLVRSEFCGLEILAYRYECIDE
jgi:hypothetical protein